MTEKWYREVDKTYKLYSKYTLAPKNGFQKVFIQQYVYNELTLSYILPGVLYAESVSKCTVTDMCTN